MSDKTKNRKGTRQKRDSTPSFVCEFPLKTNKYIDKKLGIKFRCLRDLYNMTLAECFKRHKKLMNDPRYAEAIALNKSIDTKKQANDIFRELDEKYLLKESDLHTYTKEAKALSYMKDHLDSVTVQVITSRAFEAFNDYRFKKRGKPRFKSMKKGLKSICGKQNVCVYFKNGKVIWKDLVIDVVYDKKDKHGIEAHALSKNIKYCRINSRFIKGKLKYYLQLVVEGTPLQRHPISNGTWGADLGPSTIAAVGDEKAVFVPFCDDLDSIDKELKKVQRKLSRSLRMNNPNNYEPNFCKKGRKKLGKVIKGKKVWNKSNRYLNLENKQKELYRVQADKRKTSHNVLANELLETMGKYVNIEKNSYKAWQKGWFGKSISKNAPSSFVSILKRKAESAGGKVDPIDTWSSKLSQYCHVCGKFTKKPLSQRTHTCCEVNIQRDLYSGLLAKHYNSNEENVNVSQIFANWASLDTILKGAALTYNKRRVCSVSAISGNNHSFRRVKRKKRRSHGKSNELLVSSPKSLPKGLVEEARQ